MTGRVDKYILKVNVSHVSMSYLILVVYGNTCRDYSGPCSLLIRAGAVAVAGAVSQFSVVRTQSPGQHGTAHYFSPVKLPPPALSFTTIEFRTGESFLQRFTF